MNYDNIRSKRKGDPWAGTKPTKSSGACFAVPSMCAWCKKPRGGKSHPKCSRKLQQQHRRG